MMRIWPGSGLQICSISFDLSSSSLDVFLGFAF